jgi:hypothetical protein
MNNDSTPYGNRFLFVVTTAFVLLTIPFHLKPDNFIVDDGYFYLQIARNIALGFGSTFNGVMPTNGYHPLWMLVCVCAASFTKASTYLVQFVATISDALILLSIYLFVDICKISRLKGATAGIGIIVLMTTTMGIWRMLEADLSLTLQLLILALFVRWQAASRPFTVVKGLSVGVLLGLALLTRLDLVFFALFVFTFSVFFFGNTSDHRVSKLFLRLLSVGAPCCLLVCPYLYWNYREFGHVVPISGAINASYKHGVHAPLYSIPVILASLLNIMFYRKRPRSPFATVVLIVSAATLTHLAYTMLFGSISAWYLTTGYLSVAFCVTWMFGRALEAVRAPDRTVAWSGLALFLVLGSLEVLRLVSNFTYTRLMHGNVQLRSNYLEPKRALAESLSQMLPKGSRIYIFDGPGGVAYYSGMSIIPTDGLVADYSYNEKLLAEGVSKYMADENINYIIAPVVQEGQTFRSSALDASKIAGGEKFVIYAPLRHRSAGSFAVSDQDRLATFATVVPDEERSFPKVAIWRVRH